MGASATPNVVTPRYQNSSGNVAAGILGTGQQARSDYLDVAAELTRPEFYDPDIGMLEQILEDQTKLGELRSRRTEAEMDPERAAAREDAEARVLALMDTDDLLNEQLVDAGLAGAIGSGNYLSEGETVGNAIAENIYGRGFMDDYMQRLMTVLQYLEANPEPGVTIDPVTLISELMNQGNQRANTFNQRNNYLASLTGQLMADQLQDGSNVMSMGQTEAGANVNAYNQADIYNNQSQYQADASRAAAKNAIGKALLATAGTVATAGMGAPVLAAGIAGAGAAGVGAGAGYSGSGVSNIHASGSPMKTEWIDQNMGGSSGRANFLNTFNRAGGKASARF